MRQLPRDAEQNDQQRHDGNRVTYGLCEHALNVTDRVTSFITALISSPVELRSAEFVRLPDHMGIGHGRADL
ncbi:MAG: hypothetical protein IPH10_08300 [bacterium]|nr:hypothetical protein [bacterium]